MNLKRFEQFMSALGLCEVDRFKEIFSENKWLETKTAEPTPGKSHENQKKNFDLDVADEKELNTRFSVLDNQVE